MWGILGRNEIWVYWVCVGKCLKVLTLNTGDLSVCFHHSTGTSKSVPPGLRPPERWKQSHGGVENHPFGLIILLQTFNMGQHMGFCCWIMLNYVGLPRGNITESWVWRYSLHSYMLCSLRLGCLIASSCTIQFLAVLWYSYDNGSENFTTFSVRRGLWLRNIRSSPFFHRAAVTG